MAKGKAMGKSLFVLQCGHNLGKGGLIMKGKICNVGQLLDYLLSLPRDASIETISTGSDLLPLNGGLEIGEEISFDEFEKVLSLCL